MPRPLHHLEGVHALHERPRIQQTRGSLRDRTRELAGSAPGWHRTGRGKGPDAMSLEDLENSMPRSAFVPLMLAGLLLPGLSSKAEGQLRGGVHAFHAGEAFDGATGVGIRGGVQLPVVPLDLLMSGEYLLPACPIASSGCGLRGVTADVNLRMTLPVIRPYVSGGVAHRQYLPGGDGEAVTSTGPSAGVGFDVRLGQLGAFAEARYEFVEAPRSQGILRIGLLLGL